MLAWTTGPVSAFSIGIAGDDIFQISSSQGYGPKEQGGGGAELYVLFPILSWLRVGASFGLFETLPSDTTGGFVYRGYGTGALGVSVEAAGVLSQSEAAGTLEAGGRVGLNADWGAYQYTSLFFFYPETLAEPFLGFRFAGLPSLQARLSLPFRVQFRRDLDYSFSASLALGVNYTFGTGR
ncbi:MAG: hypothetical protein ABSG17_15150 [Spirochaetia bacterium]